MSDFAVLFLVLVAIYLSDCVAWLPSVVHPFRARPRGPWIAAHELLSLRDGRWRAWFAGLIPGTGGIVSAEAEPIRVSPLGLCACREAGTSARPIPLERLVEVRVDDETLRLESRKIGRLATREFARETAAWLAELAAEDLERRASRIEARWTSMLDVRSARRALHRYDWCVRGLILPVRLLAFAMYALLPIAVARRGMFASWPEALLVVALVIGVTTIYVRRLSRLGHRREAPSHAAMMLLAPPLAIRADDLAGRDLFPGHHFLAVARVACRYDEAMSLAAARLRAIRFPIAADESSCCEAASWARATWNGVVERWITEQFSSAEALLGPPVRESERVRSYCPRCAQQFERDGGQCPDCEGIILERFA